MISRVRRDVLTATYNLAISDGLTRRKLPIEDAGAVCGPEECGSIAFADAAARSPRLACPVPQHRRYVTYRYTPTWQAAPGDTSCCPNNILVNPLGRYSCGH